MNHHPSNHDAPTKTDKRRQHQEFFNGLLQTYPSFAPHATPAYTNTGYQILAYALEGLKGKSFESLMEESILKPLGLSHTYYNGAPASVGIIPGSRLEAQWDFQLGDEDPYVYSSLIPPAQINLVDRPN